MISRPQLAVVLTTCDRLDYTRRTLETLAAHNDLSAFALYHGDDASTERAETLRLVRSFGFKTLVKTKSRIGGHNLRATVLRRMALRRVEWVLTLENDIASVRPFPWGLFEYAVRLKGVYCFRLYGQYKDAERMEPAKCYHQWRHSETQVRWKRVKKAPEPCEIAQIHWSAQPSVTRYEDLMALYGLGYRELKKRTVRVVDNVMVHIGQQRTRDLAL